MPAPQGVTPVQKKFDCSTQPNLLDGGGTIVTVTSYLGTNTQANVHVGNPLMNLLSLSITPPANHHLACMQVVTDSNNQVKQKIHIDNSPRGIASCQYGLQTYSASCKVVQ